jgi:hypothetical protein
MKLRLVALCLVAPGLPLAAQSYYGGGTAAMSLGTFDEVSGVVSQRVSVKYFWENIGEPRRDRLIAAVLLRTHTPGQHDDGGAAVDYDRKTSQVRVGDRTYATANGDSAVVITIDRADSVGGAPVTRVIVMPAPPLLTRPWPARLSKKAEERRGTKESQARSHHFNAIVRRDPVAKEFLGTVGER